MGLTMNRRWTAVAAAAVCAAALVGCQKTNTVTDGVQNEDAPPDLRPVSMGKYLASVPREPSDELLSYALFAGEKRGYAVFLLGTSRTGDAYYPYGEGHFHREVCVTENGKVIETLTVDEPGDGFVCLPSTEIVSEVDLDFDGEKDLVVWDGVYSGRGFRYYHSYLTTESGMRAVDTHSLFCDLHVNPEAKRLYAVSHSASSFTFLSYRFGNGAFLPCEMCDGTPELDTAENEPDVTAEALPWRFVFSEYREKENDWQETACYVLPREELETLTDEASFAAFTASQQVLPLQPVEVWQKGDPEIAVE